jgi:hypothetical protein
VGLRPTPRLRRFAGAHRPAPLLRIALPRVCLTFGARGARRITQSASLQSAVFSRPSSPGSNRSDNLPSSMMRTALCALFTVGLVAGPQVAAVATPEAIAGAWETANGGNIDGIFLATVGTTVPLTHRGESWIDLIQIRVYHRDAGHEASTWYSQQRRDAEFDGNRLQVAGYDVSFQEDHRSWTGTRTLDGEKKRVVLERPHPATGAVVSPFCGQWRSLPDARLNVSGSLQFAQSLDGTLTAWMMRSYSGLQRYGESLIMVSTDKRSVVLEREGLLGPPYWYSATVSADSARLTGKWHEGYVNPSYSLWVPITGPRTFRRVQGCS